MKRRLLIFVTVLWLPLFIATCGLWGRSYWISDGFIAGRHGTLYACRVSRGRVQVIGVDRMSRTDGFQIVRWQHVLEMEQMSARVPGASTFDDWSPDSPAFRHLGFLWERGVHENAVLRSGRDFWDTVSRPYRFLIVPLWFIATLTGWPLFLLCMGSLHRLRRRINRDPTVCLKCGYDLRATRERCPECGTPVSRVQQPE